MRARAAISSAEKGGAARRARLCLAALTVALLTCCVGGQGGPRGLLEFVPATSVVTAAIDWRAVRADAELGRIIPAQSVGELFAALGLAGEEVDELVIFGDGRDARTGSAGVILRGSFDPEEAVERLRGRGWREESRPDGATLYVSPGGDEYCAMLDDLLVAGSRAGVAATVEHGGDDSLASNPVYEKLADRLEDTDAPVLIVVAAPQRVQDMADAGLAISSAALDFARLEMLAGLVRQLGAVRGVGCALAHEGEGFPVEMVAVMRDEETAGLVSGTLNLAQGLVSVAPDPAGSGDARREALSQFGQMSIERAGDVLSIKTVMTEAQLRGR